MESGVYVRMLDDVFSHVDMVALSDCMGEKVSSRRQGMLMDVFRAAVGSSSLGVYSGDLWWFDGVCYVCVSDDEFSNLVYDLLKLSGVNGEDFLKIEPYVRVLRRQVMVNELRTDNSKLTFSNCVLDLDTCTEVEASASVATFTRMTYAYDPSAQCYEWRHFLDEVLPDERHQRILQEFCGCMLIDRKKVKIEKMCILKGSGANGKSVVFDVLCALFGEGNVSHYSLKSLLTGQLERKRNICGINGKRLNYASETDRVVFPTDSSLLKALVSGEPLEGRALRGVSFVARDIPMLMMNANQLPVIKDWSFGMRRRLIVLPFNVEIPKWKQDATLSTRLKGELSGIMNWVLEGRERFVRNQYKFTESDAIDKLLDAYQGEISNVITFMLTNGYQRRSDVIKGAVPIWVRSQDLLQEYTKWCIATDDVAEGRRKFVAVLRDGGWRVVRRSAGIYIGLYGERALNRQKWLMKLDHAANELNVKYKGERHYNYKMVRERAEKVMIANGWLRCAVGFTDLQEYLGYTFDWRRHMNTGKLEGCYVVDDGIYFFDLNAIDTIWRPQYEAQIKDRIRRKIADEEYKKLVSGEDDGKEFIS